MSLLTASGLDVTARIGAQSVQVLRDVSFTLEPGRSIGLVGESGAGKSMIGRLIAGMLPPAFRVSRGSLKFRGEELVGRPASAYRALLGKDIAFIPQHPMTSLNPVLTVGRQFDEHLARLGLASRAARRARAIELMNEVNLAEPQRLLERYPHQLSGGMCQRVLIALAFAGNPPLIIADEPTTALDVITQARIMRLIQNMRSNHNSAVVFITHDLRLAAQVCDDIVVMYAGEIVERAPGRELFARPLHPYTEALQRCNPALTGERRRLISLPDHMPGILSFAGLKGCRFAPRCPVADQACAAAPPPLVEALPGRFVRAAGQCQAHTRIAAAPGQVEAIVPRANAVPILKAEGLGKTFESRDPLAFWRVRRVEAVKNVSFEVAPGEFVGIVGQSGSGKSTLARLLLGLEDPTAGKLTIGGDDLTGRFSEHAERRVGLIQMIFQDPTSALNPRRRIANLVTQSMEAEGSGKVPWQKRIDRARQLLKDTGLAPDTVDRFPSQVSGGQRQRVNIARALCATPQVLVADEIVSGLDVSVQAQILNLLFELRAASDVALILISHDLAVVRYLCSRVMVMYRGAVVEHGRTEDVFANPQHWYTRSLIAAVPPDDPATTWNLDAVDARARDEAQAADAA